MEPESAQNQPAISRNPAAHLAEHKFPPGQSGNPGGRPRGRSISSRLRDLLEKGEIDGKPIKGGKQVADMLAETILKGALKGDFRFAKEVLDRVEGKVPDRIAGVPGEPIIIRVIEAVRPPSIEDEG